MDKKAFFDAVRPHVNLTTQNVVGFDKVLDYGEARGSRLPDLAYILATAYWESAQTMHPVVEAYWLSEDWRRKNLRYYPWHGRGLIQTTWRDNYVKMGKEIGVDLTKRPDMLLEWPYALPALFVGMEKGLYTGKDLDDYIDDVDESDTEDLREFSNARRIVNGTDKAATIGKLAIAFEKGLKAAKYKAVKPVAVIPPDIPVTPNPPAPDPAEGVTYTPPGTSVGSYKFPPQPDDPGVSAPASASEPGFSTPFERFVDWLLRKFGWR